VKQVRREKAKASWYMASAVVTFLVGLSFFAYAGVMAYAASYADGDGRIARLALGLGLSAFGWLFFDFASKSSDRALMHEIRAVELLKDEADEVMDGDK
jgi:hypothetical protein